VILPKEKGSFPEPYSVGESFSGFSFRGTKGWMWTPEQYLTEIPCLAKCKMNFLMNCYASMADIEHYGWGNPECNRWWEPLAEDKKREYEKIVRSCQKHGIEFCFSMNPNLCSKRPLDYHSDKDADDLWKHYEWMQSLGVKWFNISLDDISQGIDAAGQAGVVNDLFARLRRNDPEAQMIFTPTHYWGDGANDPYLKTLSKDLHSDVFIFWTGPQVVSLMIGRKETESYKEAVGHRLFIWDNYPVNDGAATMHLGPVLGRDGDLPEVVDGYMSNPLHEESQINRIPLMTCADYAYNPKAYDPSRSLGQAILCLGKNTRQREILRDLVELYPGMIVLGVPRTSWNPLLNRYDGILSAPHSRWMAKACIDHVQDVATRMGKEFPKEYIAAQNTLRDDLDKMKAGYTSKYGERP